MVEIGTIYMPGLVRASGLDLFLSCNGYLHLPEAREHFEKAEEAAEWGTMVHTWAETGLVAHKNKRTATSFRKRLKALNLKPTDLWDADGEHEVSVAYNWRYGYAIPFYGRGKEAAEWKASFNVDWITGTIDYIKYFDRGVNDLPYVKVDDLKTGKWWDKDPIDSAQIAFYGMCAWKWYTCPVELGVTHWPRYPATSEPDQSTNWITPEMWEIFERKLQRSCENAMNPEFNPTEEHCRFCPGRNACLFAWDYSDERKW